MFYEVIPGRIFRNGAGVLTYSSETELKPGQVVVVPLGRSRVPAIVVRQVKEVDFETKPIERVLYQRPLPKQILKAIFWMAEYYLIPLPSVVNLFLPVGVMKKRKKAAKDITDCGEKTAILSGSKPRVIGTELDFTRKSAKLGNNAEIELNSAQKIALEALKRATTTTKLLFGVTGSGKTNIYLKLAENALKQQKSIILLVPEIALTSQLVQIFRGTFGGRVILIHSKQTEAERHLIWEKILGAEEPIIVIGPRSALLTPIKDLGLIIIDEAHEGAYFQENTPKYSALRLASAMAAAAGADCILGTATPLAVDYSIAKNRDALVILDKKAKKTAKPPEVKIISLRDKQNFLKNRYFADALLAAMARNIKNKQQTLIFHNRRGAAPLTLCERCGWQALCPNCFLPLTLHTDTYALHCHTCGFSESIPSGCPECKHPSIVHKGFGTKLLETELKKLFPEAKIARFDADNGKNDSLAALFSEVKQGEIDILIGTQTVARGLDLPKLASVGIVQADAGLSLPDFMAEERTFQLLTQVIGRVGRGHLDIAEVFIQTFQPDNPTIKLAANENYLDFADYLLKKRCAQKMPPFYYIAKVAVTYKTERTVLAKIKEIERVFKGFSGKILLSPPMPSFHERTAQGYTWQIILRARKRGDLVLALKAIPTNIPAHITIDPLGLL